MSLEHRYAWEESRARWLDMRAYPTGDGNLAVFWRDVTDRKGAEDALRASEARLQNAFRIQTVGVMFWGEGFGLTDVNEAYLRMTGLTREEALGKSWAELTPPEFHEVSLKAMDEVLTRGETTPFEKR